MKNEKIRGLEIKQIPEIYDNNGEEKNKEIALISRNKKNFSHGASTFKMGSNGMVEPNTLLTLSDVNNDNNYLNVPMTNSSKYKIKKVSIQDVKSGQYVLSLNETSGARRSKRIIRHGAKTDLRVSHRIWSGD